ncbi:hypothetical protein [Helicobacter cetorum]|uniref:hypothetical protein n=1 Tax=Helicobacter cetorum TaxID=138563 RepID=UPI0002D3273B|nr:hypothetical protein [Helicobacter cetorum]
MIEWLFKEAMQFTSTTNSYSNRLSSPTWALIREVVQRTSEFWKTYYRVSLSTTK